MSLSQGQRLALSLALEENTPKDIRWLLVEHPDEAVRLALALNPLSSPELLAALKTDASVPVQRLAGCRLLLHQEGWSFNGLSHYHGVGAKSSSGTSQPQVSARGWSWRKSGAHEPSGRWSYCTVELYAALELEDQEFGPAWVFMDYRAWNTVVEHSWVAEGLPDPHIVLHSTMSATVPQALAQGRTPESLLSALKAFESDPAFGPQHA